MDPCDYYVKNKDGEWELLTVEPGGKIYLRAKMFAPPPILAIAGIDLTTAKKIQKPDA